MKNRNLGLFVACVLAAFLLASAAMAQPPQTVLIQGQLLNSGGAPLSGNRDYLIRFYDDPTAGTQLGADLSGSTTVSAEGIFAIPVVPPAAVLGAAQSWYELSLDSAPVPNGVDANDVFPNRIEVHSVPFAQVAGKAMNVDVADVGDGSISQTELSALSGVTANVQTQMDAKANTVNVYTKTEMDSSQSAQDTIIAGKANSSDLFQWQVVNAGPVQMEVNKGYIVDSASELMLTLPDSASLAVGDVVRISGIAAGGWRVAQNAGQQILTEGLVIANSSTTWTPRDSSRDWRDVASSADGTKLVAGVYNGQLYTSTDSGVSWTPRESNRQWWSVASSADGTKLLAAAYNGQLYTSTDSGATWFPRDSNRLWWSLASSADGTKLVATVLDGQIYTSTDSGLTWLPRDSNRVWQDVASSADGTKLVATVFNGQIYTSIDSGLTWIGLDSNRKWREVASSADGSKLVAFVAFEQIYTYSNIIQQTTAGISGGITGPQHGAIELQYIGNDTFQPLSYVGSLGAQ